MYYVFTCLFISAFRLKIGKMVIFIRNDDTLSATGYMGFHLPEIGVALYSE